MSYRELRNFTEIMRSLGYPRLISMENFRKPNFELVADILYWMVKLYDPDTTISDRVEFENERVEFLSGIAALMAAKARLKLNTKKLYASDGRAVQELLKLATLLYKASSTVNNLVDSDAIPPPIKVQDVKVARGLASEITQSGAKLYDLLASEAAERLERSRSLRFLDTAGAASEGSKEYAFIERSVREIIENTKQAVEDARKESEELEVDEKNLESKIRKKQEELERTEKRLRSLENVRPQFMEEVDKLEKELQYHYDIYIEKFRNLDFLEKELEKYHKAEEERKLEHEKKLQKVRERLYREEVEILRGKGAKDSEGDENENVNSKRLLGSNASGQKTANNAQGSTQQRQQYAAAQAKRTAKAQGSMTAHSDDESSDADSDDGVSEGNAGDSDEEELSIASKNEGKSDGRMKSNGYGQPGAARKPDRKAVDEDDFVDDDDGDDDDMSGDDEGSNGSDF